MACRAAVGLGGGSSRGEKRGTAAAGGAALEPAQLSWIPLGWRTSTLAQAWHASRQPARAPAKRPPPHLPVVAAAHRHVWPAEGHEGCQRSQAAGVHQVSLVIQHMNIHPKVPHLAACSGEARPQGSPEASEALRGRPTGSSLQPPRCAALCSGTCTHGATIASPRGQSRPGAARLAAPPASTTSASRSTARLSRRPRSTSRATSIASSPGRPAAGTHGAA